ncbi:undecaprenyl-phosphate glucose phosphotransferase [Enterovirga sp.]|jgi:Undecaprenyl-phosphate glucose phosphotransferase|uniref:undecaprenyl-phosphate glucose phosphotransferase n=1 Tax=Enterovirga sp. TaxID=2026350 RepID=UPI00260F8C47|nr:undecaprenyl-phosphate glucose phosphotransferase [Enterovirga sp.]MDB5592262.1 undecaprenyl-phosphate glucose phosphotransferase [Enterovirga sp.]
MSIDIRQMLSATPGVADQPDARRTGAIRIESRSSRISPVVVTGIVRIVEATLVLVTGAAVHLAYVSKITAFGWGYATAVVAVAALATLAFQAIGAYTIGALRSFLVTGLKLTVAWTVVFLSAIALLFFLKAGDQFSRVWLGIWYGGGLVSLLSFRFAASRWVRAMTRAGRFDRRTAIVGGGEPANEIIRLLQAQPESGIRIVGVYDDRDDDRSPKVIGGYEKLGRVSDLVEHARRTPVDLVIFTLPISAENRLLQMLGKLWVLPIDIRLSAHASKLRLRPRSYSYVGSVPVLDVFDRPIADWDHVIKWLFDKIVGSVLLVLCSPILLLAAIAVKLDSPGPILFRQKRYGFNNELVEVLKFRSMRVDATDAAASKLVVRDDPRVTRVGRFLRRTSIDELPQLLNVVFRGNLSLVGPRPHALQAKAADRLYDQVVDSYFARHRVKPGITGWAQINGWRGETDTQEKLQRRVEHDLHYIENWSVFFDLYIMLATPFALLKHDTAY